MTRHVIVGNGIAGVTAALSIVRADEAAEVHIYSAEPHLYYRRPQLPALIAGEVAEADITYRPRSWYQERGIHVHTGSPVAGLDPAAHRISLEDGTSLPYDRLLLATGGRARVPPLEGVTLEGVFTLRTLEDSRGIRERAGTARSAVVVGGGLLGLESARALRALGLEVTILELYSYLMPRQVDREGAAVLQGLVESLGIRVLTNARTEAILGDGAVAAVQVEGGPRLEAQIVVCATGWQPETGLARRAGLEVNRGVVVGPHLQTSAEDVYAAGDVAEAGEMLYGIVPAAVEQARIAAANMVSPGSATYQGTLPFTTLKVVGAELTSVGNAVADDETAQQLRHIDLENRHYRKFVIRDGKIVGAILLNDRARSIVVRQLVEKGVDVSGYIDRLIDDDFDLRSL